MRKMGIEGWTGCDQDLLLKETQDRKAAVKAAEGEDGGRRRGESGR